MREVLEKALDDSIKYRKYHHAQEVIAKFHPNGELAYYESELFKLLSQDKLPSMIRGFLNDDCETKINIPILIDYYLRKYEPGADTPIFSNPEHLLKFCHDDAEAGFAIYHDYWWLIKHRDSMRSKDTPFRFDFGFEEKFIRKLFRKLIGSGYFEKDADFDSFLWAFGYVQPPEVFRPIAWRKTSGALSDLLLALQQKKEKDSLRPHTSLQRRTADKASGIFIKNGSPVKISKRNRESGRFNQIKEIVDNC